MRYRIAAIAGITVLLTLVSSSAMALWTSGASVSSVAKTATVGITQVIPATPDLVHTYAAAALVAASPVTLTNTGNRAASYTLSLLAASTSTGLPGSVAVSIAPVATAAACTRTATLTSATTGTLSTSTALTATGTFAPSASVILCVRTSMTAANVVTYAEKSLSLAISSTSTLGTWSASPASVSTVTQDVASAQLYSTDRSGRYSIFAASGSCIEAYSGTKLIATGSATCSATSGQWRITKDASSGNYSIAVGTNGASTGTGWNFVSPTGLSIAAVAATAAQRWAIEARADGKYRFRNESSGLCAVVTTVGADDPNTSTRPLVQVATCNDTVAAQGFTLTLLGNPVPATPYAMTCTGNGTNYIQIVWPGATGYEQEIDYKFYVNNIFVKDVLDGYNPYAQLFRPNDLAIATYGSGSVPVRAEQSIAGSAWTVTATGTMYIEPGTNNLKCAP